MTSVRHGANLLFECDECGALSPSLPDEDGNCTQTRAWKLAESLGWRVIVDPPPFLRFLCGEHRE